MKRILFLTLFIAAACSVYEKKEMKKSIRLITLDPGHFNADLIQKSMYPMVDSTVYVYAPDSPDVHGHLSIINAYINRQDIQTRWNENYYICTHFFERLDRVINL